MSDERVAWRERFNGGRWKPVSGFQSICEFCGEVTLSVDPVALATQAQDHASDCPDAPSDPSSPTVRLIENHRNPPKVSNG